MPQPSTSTIALALSAWMLAALASNAPAQSGVVEPTQSMPSLKALQAQGLLVGEIRLDIGDVFDTTLPGENKSLFRWANRVHINSRPTTIRSQLLFRPGEPIDAQRIEESERLIRANPFIFDASIRPVAIRGDEVDFVVHTRDNWTLFPEIGLSRTGGETRWQLGLEEDNLLGTGTSVTVARRSDDDRTSTEFFFNDRNLGRTWIAMNLAYRDSDDGEARRIRVAQPFYALTSTRSFGVEVSSDDRQDPLFSLGSEVGRYRRDQRLLNAFWGWSRGLQDGWTTRWLAGVVVNDLRFGEPVDEVSVPRLPADRDLRYPYLSVQRIENRFVKVQNLNQIMQTEDLFLGRQMAITVGFADSGFGADRSAVILAASANTSRGDPGDRFTTFASRFSGRLESGTLVNGQLSFDAEYYRRQSPKRVAFAGVRLVGSRRLDLDNPVTLGGDNGLRGYDRSFGNGEHSVLFTVEQRFYTDWYPWRLFRVGGALFADVGRVWGADITGFEDDRWHADVGFGLRLGNARGNSNRVFHIDIALPLRDGPGIDGGVQVLVQSKRGF